MSSKINVNYNLLEISQNPIAPYIIAAFSMVYGTEFQELIKSRVDKTLFIHYKDLDGIVDYREYLKNCKSRELAVEFLRRIGCSVPEKENLNYADSFELMLEWTIDNYLGVSEQAFNRRIDSPTIPLKLFKLDNLSDNDIERKIKLINQIRGKKDDLITYATLNEFESTDEYKKIRDMIFSYETLYEKMLNEFTNWKKSLSHYDEYIEEESERKESILKEKENELYNAVYKLLPNSLKKKINDLSVDEKKKFIIGDNLTNSNSIFEAFSKDNMDILYSDKSPLYEKYWIVNEQIVLFKRLGIDVPDERILGCSCDKDVQEYRKFIERKEIWSLIPEASICEKIACLHANISKETVDDYYCTSESFLKMIRYFSNDESTRNYFYNVLKRKKVYVSAFTEFDSVNNCDSIIPFLCYTVRPSSGGCLAFALFHEFGHVIDYNDNGSAFESAEELLKDSDKGNPYSKKYRYYERFNEAINDIFTLEAIKILNSKGIYLLEEKNLTSRYLEDVNTSKIVKDMIRPLIKKFRKQVVTVKLTSIRSELTDYVGEENFNELVDAVNKVDYLVSLGLREMLAARRETALVRDYYKELDRVSKIYVKMDEYYSNHFNSSDAVKPLCYNKRT